MRTTKERTFITVKVLYDERTRVVSPLRVSGNALFHAVFCIIFFCKLLFHI